MKRVSVSRIPFVITMTACMFLMSMPLTSFAQVVEAFDDEFFLPLGFTLVVEPFGVLDNDLLDDENAGESGATASLVTDVLYGTLALAPDGSFTYSDGAGFDGHDSFTYQANFGGVSAQATVVISACTTGPDVFACWNKNEYLAKAAELGLTGFHESFEDETAWGIARSPLSVESVVSQGVRWMSNHVGAPAYNSITTGTGPVWDGLYGFYDPEHGYAYGSPTECDVDNPPEHCQHFDGWTGVREPGFPPLRGVGGYVDGMWGSKVEIRLDDVPVMTALTGYGHFIGVLDARPAGFTTFRFTEVDGKIGQSFYIWGDDFLLYTDTPTTAVDTTENMSRVFFAGAGPNPSDGNTALYFQLDNASGVRLEIFDSRGRLVKRLAHAQYDAGRHAIGWDGRDHDGRHVAAGTFFGRLSVTRDGAEEVQVRKVVVTR